MEQNSKMYREKIVVKDDFEQVTYVNFYERVTNCIHYFRELGLKKGDRVGIHLESCVDFVISIYAALSLQVIYVPLSIKDPTSRLFDLIRDCKPKIIITREHSIKLFTNENFGNTLFVPIDKGQLGKHPNNSHENIDETLPSDDPYAIAYIVYTSGSTGKPKGVAVRHESISNFISETIKIFGFNETTRSLVSSPFHFDGSLGSVLCTIFAGGTLVIVSGNLLLPRTFIDLLINECITHISGVPSYLQVLFKNIDEKIVENIKLKTIGLGGEECPVRFVKQLKIMFPKVRIFNRYGPTETTVVVASCEITDEILHINSKIPIGTPQNNVSFHVFNDSWEPISEGESGELLIGGIQLMEGYWNDKELTEKVLNYENPLGIKLYRTGDIVSINAQGQYVYLDRSDNMIKKYGNRIYLSEIEEAINSLEWVRACVCKFKKNERGSLIIAFIEFEQEVKQDEVNRMLQNKLPKYMLPDSIVKVNEFPLMNNGKIDRKQLDV